MTTFLDVCVGIDTFDNDKNTKMLRTVFETLLFVALDEASPEPNTYSHRGQYRCVHIDVIFRCTFASVSYCIS